MNFYGCYLLASRQMEAGLEHQKILSRSGYTAVGEANSVLLSRSLLPNDTAMDVRDRFVNDEQAVVCLKEVINVVLGTLLRFRYFAIVLLPY